MKFQPLEQELPALTPVQRGARKRRGTPEDDLQRMIWRALQRVLHPEVVAWSSEHRNNGTWEGMRRRARGCIRGVPDMVFHWPHGQICYIELKVKGGYPSEDQKALRQRLERAGVPVSVCRSLDEVLSFLRHCGVPLRIAAP